MRLAVFVLFLTSGCSFLSSDKTQDGVMRALDCASSPGCRSERPPEVGQPLRGQVVHEGPVGTQPVSYARVLLLRGDQTVLTVATDRAGRFALPRGVDDGRYRLVLESDRFEGELPVEVGGERDEVLLVARPRAAGPAPL